MFVNECKSTRIKFLPAMNTTFNSVYTAVSDGVLCLSLLAVFKPITFELSVQELRCHSPQTQYAVHVIGVYY